MSTENSSSSISIQLAHSLHGHTSDINTVLFSSTSTNPLLLASGSSDKTIRLWNLNDQSSRTITRHTYQVHCLAFSPILNDKHESNAKYLASVSTDGTCLLWDLSTISVLKEYKHDSGLAIRACQFSSDGVLLATAGDDELINIWDITASSSRPVKTLSGHSATIVALRCFSNLLISGSFNGDLKIWMINSSFTGPVHFEREAHDLGVTCIDVLCPSVDEKHTHHHHPPYFVATGGNDNNVKIWHCSTSSKHHLTHIRTLQKHTCAVMCVSFGVNHYLASGSGDKTIILWNFETGHSIYQFEAHSRYVTCCSFSSDGQYLASASNDRLINVWKIDYQQNKTKNNENKHLKTKISFHSIPIDQWTNEIVQQWLEHFHIAKQVDLTGQDLLSKSDHEILDLFEHNQQLLNELSSLRHRNFIKQVSLKRTDQILMTDEENKRKFNIPDEFFCPITHEIMYDPVCAADGYTYERKAIQEWLDKKQTSPIMNLPMKETQVYSNKILKMLIDKYFREN